MTTEPETLDFLFALLEYLRPAVIVEAGTWRGDFAIEAARRLPDSHVYSADVIRAVTDPGLPNLTLFHGDFGEMLEDGMPFDFAFIDSGPSNEDFGVRLRHWHRAKFRVSPGGLVVCHDMIHRDWMGGEEIASESLLLNGGKGLALWRK